MKIRDIYTKYQIPEMLQLHMYRVAAVGLLVIDFVENNIKLEKDIVTKTLLLHDMGNIIKFNLDNNPLLKEEEFEPLKKIQADFILKYGNDDKIATISIVKELEVEEKVIDILENTGSSNMYLTVRSDNWYRKVCSYADYRVAPHGVVGVEERFDDVIKRYRGGDHELSDVKKTTEKKECCMVLEKQIQEKSEFPLSSIDDSKIKPLVEELKEYNI